MLLVDQQGLVVAINSAAGRLIGHASSEIIGQSIDTFFSTPINFNQDTNSALPSSEEDPFKTNHSRHAQNTLSTTSETRIVELSIVSQIADFSLVLLHDITERVEHDAIVQRYELLIRRTRDIILFIGRNGKITDANEAACLAYGYSRDELLRLAISDLRAPDTRDSVSVQLEEAFSQGLLFETFHVRKDGSTFPVEVGSRNAKIGDEMMLISIIRDISERRQMQAKLVQADRLAAVGTLAAGVAHEINNPLTYVLGNLELIERDLSIIIDASLADENLSGAALRLAHRVAVAREGAERVRGIVRGLKSFSRPDDERLEVVNLFHVLDSSVNLASNELRHKGTLERDYLPIPFVLGNPARLGQVFLNVVINAAQALPDGHFEQNHVRVKTFTDSLGNAVIEISDTGVGVPDTMLGRVFDPFVSTKPVGEGTGLGLFISRGIVLAHHGDIAITSHEGRGTTVTITLPAAPSTHTEPTSQPNYRVTPTALLSDRPSSEPPSSGQNTLRRSKSLKSVLVVDDDVALGRAIASFLRDSWLVHFVDTSVSALELLRHGRRFDALLIDIMMPGVSGNQLVELIHNESPEIVQKIVLMSGGVVQPHLKQRIDELMIRFIEKPFSLEAVQKILSEASR